MSPDRGSCFHCGEPLPPGDVRHVHVDGAERPVCCPGCEAVASLIAGAGLTDFYRYRSGPAPTPDPHTPDEWSAYDRTAVQHDLVRRVEDGRAETALFVEGLYCAACAWLIEHVLGRLDGVVDVQVNPATGRALLRWDPERAALSALLRRIDELGYRPHPVAAGEAVPAATRERRAALRRLAVAGLGMMQVMMYAVGLYAGAIHAGMDPQIERLLRGVSLLVATPVVIYAGAPFFRGAWRDLRALRPGMDVPVALAVGAGFAASVWNTLIASGEVYFDSVTMFVFFLSVARFLEMSARHRAAGSLDAAVRTLPATAVRLEADGTETRVARAELGAGDRVRVRSGECVPADGEIERGEGRLDEAVLTGEYEPAARGPADPVLAGSTNAGDPIDVTVTRVGADTLVSGIARLLERAQAERPRIARLADGVARWFVAGVLAAAAGTAVAWTLHAPAMAFPVTLAVLVVTCPCALSLATPTALVAATAALARRGIVVSRTGSLEPLARARRVVLDKTGTLTLGRITLARTEAMDRVEAAEARALAAALEAHSEHPIARAFSPWADGRDARRVHVERGRGIEGIVDGRRLRLGRPDWVGGLAGGGDTGGGETVIALGDDDGLLARFRLSDVPRPDAAETVAALRALGLEPEIASGDAEGPVAALAAELGIGHWQARQSPADKLERLRALQAGGERVIMVGDGINDAPVLGGADVSAAMGGGSALAQASADLLLTGERLSDLPRAVRAARRTRAVIAQNIAWALAYNLTALPLAAAGLVAPWMAALGMSASSLIVVANAIRLGRGDRAERPRTATTAPAEAAPAA